MNIVGVSHIGNSRPNHEDNFLIGKTILKPDTVRLFSSEQPCVCIDYTDNADSAVLAISDGMGGHASGEVASYLTVKYLCDNYDEIADCNVVTLKESISKLNRTVSDATKKNPEYRDMGATLCGFIYNSGRILGFNVGDSRLYSFEKGMLLQLSRDHSEGQRLLDLKLLNEEELKSFPNRKAIYKYIGMKTNLVADIFEITHDNTDTVLLLCSDGLTDVLTDCEIQNILSSKINLKEKCERMLSTALEKNIGHGDNITLILSEF